MSKLAFVLCTTVLFVLAMATSAYRIDKLSVTSHINTIDKRLSDRIRELDQMYYQLILPDPYYFRSINETQKNITTEIESARVAVEFIIAESTNKFNETECRSYFVEFKKAAQDVADKLDTYAGCLVMTKIQRLGEALTAAKKAQKELKDLKIRASQCYGMACFEIDDLANYAWTEANEAASGLLCRNENLEHGLNVTQILQTEPRYNDYLKEKTELAQKTITCVSSHHEHNS